MSNSNFIFLVNCEFNFQVLFQDCCFYVIKRLGKMYMHFFRVIFLYIIEKQNLRIQSVDYHRLLVVWKTNVFLICYFECTNFPKLPQPASEPDSLNIFFRFKALLELIFHISNLRVFFSFVVSGFNFQVLFQDSHFLCNQKFWRMYLQFSDVFPVYS